MSISAISFSSVKLFCRLVRHFAALSPVVIIIHLFSEKIKTLWEYFTNKYTIEAEPQPCLDFNKRYFIVPRLLLSSACPYPHIPSRVRLYLLFDLTVIGIHPHGPILRKTFRYPFRLTRLTLHKLYERSSKIMFAAVKQFFQRPGVLQ